VDLNYSADDERFRLQVRQWIAEHPSGPLGTVVEKKAWQRTLYDVGYVGMGWPREYGGQDARPMEQAIVAEEMARGDVPGAVNSLALGLIGPTLIVHGTDEQKQRYVQRMLTADDIWCQLYSEPDSGSDLASLKTRAVLEAFEDGERWMINGQKVWTSLAHLAKWGMLLARTNPDVPKHRGLSYFVVDMQAPGVEVRPLVQITGDAEFNEVFFDNVRIPDSMRVGQEGDGWRVAITTLMNERVSLSGAGSVSGDTVGGSPFSRLLVRHRGTTDPIARQRLSQAYIESRLIRLNNERAAAKRRSGGEVGPEGSITKLMSAEFNQRLQKLALDLEGVGGIAWEGEAPPRGAHRGRPTWLAEGDDRATLARGFLRAQANTIEGGTSDIMRNILGERVLGLPKDPDVSRDVAWKDVLRST